MAKRIGVELGLTKPVRDAISMYDSKVIRLTMGDTLRRTAQDSFTAAKQKAFGPGGVYNIGRNKAIKHGGIKTKSKWAEKGGKFIAAVWVYSRAISLIHFDGTKPRTVISRIGRRVGATVQIRRGGASGMARHPVGSKFQARKRPGYAFKGLGEYAGFIATGRSGNTHVYRRKSPPRGGKGARKHDRFPLTTMRTMSPSDMIMDLTVQNYMDEQLGRKFEPTFFKRLDWYLGKYGKAR